MQKVPSDRLTGSIIKVNDRHVLLSGAEVRPLPGKLLYSGLVVFRYGVALLNTPAESILPYMVYDDFQREHTGFDAIQFMVEKGDSYPRADVLGYRVSDGKYRERFMKEFDLARPLRLFAYPGEQAVTPLFDVQAAIHLEPAIIDVRDTIEGISPWLGALIPIRTMNPIRINELPAILPELFTS
jgi:hypothetical protein